MLWIRWIDEEPRKYRVRLQTNKPNYVCMCVCAAYYIYKGCTHAQHTYTFFWSAEEILLLRREKIFPLRSRKISSALKFPPRKDVCRSVGATYICSCSDRPTRIRQQMRAQRICLKQGKLFHQNLFAIYDVYAGPPSPLY